MKITLDQWLAIAAAHDKARAALHELERVLGDVALEHADPGIAVPETKLCFKFVGFVDDALTQLTRFDPRPLDEWMGGDSTKLENTNIREPNCVGLGSAREYLARGTDVATYVANKRQETP